MQQEWWAVHQAGPARGLDGLPTAQGVRTDFQSVPQRCSQDSTRQTYGSGGGRARATRFVGIANSYRIDAPLSLPPVNDIFKELDDDPLGAASLAQCHRGILRDGREVAVKIQHPDVRNNAYTDMDTVDVSIVI